MPTSTTNMLRVMGPAMSGATFDDTPVKIAPLIKITNEQPQLMPSPSMADMLNYCLSPSKKSENTPLK